jgi:ribosome maturation factor RimP
VNQGGLLRLSNAKIKPIVEELVQPYLREHGFELVDIEYVKEGSNWFLRVFVDKDGGIDIEDCCRISEYLSERLDERDPIPDAYFLEVSSPGAERPLKKPEDYRRAVGKHVYVTTYEPVGGEKVFEGLLQSYDGERLTIDTGKRQAEVPMDKVASARLAVIF